MLRLLFTSMQDETKKLAIVTDGIDGQFNVFVTENVYGDVDYFKSLGVSIEVGITYNVGNLIKIAQDNLLKLYSYPEGLNEEAVHLVEEIRRTVYTFESDEEGLLLPKEGGNVQSNITSHKQEMVNGKPEGNQEDVAVNYQVEGEGFTVNETGQVTAEANAAEESRIGKLICTQDESGKVLEITLTQAGTASV